MTKQAQTVWYNKDEDVTATFGSDGFDVIAQANEARKQIIQDAMAKLQAIVDDRFEAPEGCKLMVRKGKFGNSLGLEVVEDKPTETADLSALGVKVKAKPAAKATAKK